MEFAVAILSAAVSSAVSSAMPKLCSVIAELVGTARHDATLIKNELEHIQGIIEANSFVGSCVSPLGSRWIAQLRRLAYDIEDFIDCSKVKKTSSKDFEEEIARIKLRAEETRKQLLEYIKISKGLKESAVTSSAQGQRQQVVAPAAEVLVPHELRELLCKQGDDWLNKLNCLLYFCMFPQDHHARRDPLIRRWLAEGLVRREDEAVRFLKDLIDGKIINTTAKSNNGMMKKCQTPDEILGFIYKHSSSTSFMMFCDDMDQLIKADSARRLSLHPNKGTLDDEDLTDFSRLHTLAVFHGSANPESYETILRFGKYKVLRVLDLKKCTPLSKAHLLAICNLVMLKYLSFLGGTDRLPSEMGNLAWLETLDMRGSNTVTVYKNVLKMPRLKHLLGKFQLYVKQVSGAVWGFKTTNLANFLKGESVLETLSGFVIGDSRGFPQLMILMRKLRKVKIWCNSNASKANLDAISSAISKFVGDGIQEPAGRSLSINFQECSGQFLNNLEVQGALTSLKLQGNLSNKFPQFVAQISGVEELCLSSTSLTWNVILSELSKLRILKYLKLVEDNLGCVEILPGHLKSLERICIVCKPNLDITIKDDALAGLVSLHIICQCLDVVPGTSRMEIKHMTNLQEVGLHSQVDQTKKQAWKNAAEAHPKKPTVFDI